MNLACAHFGYNWCFDADRQICWNTTTTHHETSRYNYGLYFRWWDKRMGTEHPDYRRKFESIAAPRTPVVAAD